MPLNDTIFKRLEQSTVPERIEICKILNIDEKDINNHEKISKEFRSVSGHTVKNIIRDAHALEYIEILKDVFNGIKEPEYLGDEINLNKEQSVEKAIAYILTSKYNNLKKENSENASDEFKKYVQSKGKDYTVLDVITGPGGIAMLVTKLISLPVAISTSVAGALTAPSYQKSFLVVAQLIRIMQRVNYEKKLKDTCD